jgi:hypothetical protein
MAKTLKPKTLRLQFRNIQETLDYMAKSPGGSSEKERSADSTFTRLPNWPACERAIQFGWPEGLKAVSGLVESLSAFVGSGMLKETFRPAVSGLFFDVGLVLSGEPEAWLETTETEEETKGSKVVTLALNCTVSGCVPAATIEARGAAMLALAVLLERSGRSVRVVVGDATTRDGSYLYAETVVKEAGEPFDLDKLAFWLVCPDVLRRCFFRICEASPLREHVDARMGGGYGCPVESWTPEGDITLKGILSETAWTPEASRRWIVEQLKAQGVQFSEA